MSAAILAILGGVTGAALGALGGTLARWLVGGWRVPCRPRERDAYEARIADLEAQIERLERYDLGEQWSDEQADDLREESES